jgi:hypothetical protein
VVESLDAQPAPVGFEADLPQGGQIHQTFASGLKSGAAESHSAKRSVNDETHHLRHQPGMTDLDHCALGYADMAYPGLVRPYTHSTRSLATNRRSITIAAR